MRQTMWTKRTSSDRSTTERPTWYKRDDKRTLTGRPWRRLRERILKRDQYLCVACRKKGKLTEATEVDHIKPVAQQGTDDESNLQSLCAACHQAKTIAENGGTQRQAIGVDGWPVEG